MNYAGTTWLLRSLAVFQNYCFGETRFDSESEARAEFDRHKERSKRSGGRYQLFAPGASKPTDSFSFSAENE
jgi:hypothetical protein